MNINKNKINLKLIYKYLKNLFIVVDSPEILNNYLNICYEEEKEINNFFNGIFSYLQREYDTIFINTKNIKNNSEIKDSELIKSLCIQFLDLIFSGKNIKKINENKLKKNNKKLFFKSQKNLGSFINPTIPNRLTSSFISNSSNNNIIITEKNKMRTDFFKRRPVHFLSGLAKRHFRVAFDLKPDAFRHFLHGCVKAAFRAFEHYDENLGKAQFLLAREIRFPHALRSLKLFREQFLPQASPDFFHRQTDSHRPHLKKTALRPSFYAFS